MVHADSEVGPASEVSRTAVEAVITYFFRQYPTFARRAGWHTVDGCLPNPGPISAGELDLAETHLSSYLRDYALRTDRDAAMEAHLAALSGFVTEATRTLPDQLSAGDWLDALDLVPTDTATPMEVGHVDANICAAAA
jgi:hypothetical protein